MMGVLVLLAAESGDADRHQHPPAFFGWIFIRIAGGSMVTLGWTLAALVLAAGRMLARRRRYLFCLVVAGIECVFMPLGTVLGVFTIIVLVRPSVKAAFEANSTAGADPFGPPPFQG